MCLIILHACMQIRKSWKWAKSHFLIMHAGGLPKSCMYLHGKNVARLSHKNSNNMCTIFMSLVTL